MQSTLSKYFPGCLLLLIPLCYLWVDREVARQMAAWQMQQYALLHWLEKMPEVLTYVFPLLLLSSLWALYRKRFSRLQRLLFSTAVSVIGLLTLRLPVKALFGRYWPDTFRDNNPSLLQHEAYGFNPFSWGISYQSFPSGHTAEIVAFSTVLWFYYPRLRVPAILLAIGGSLPQILLYYHFVSDVLAGILFGMTLGLGAAWCSEWLAKKRCPEEATTAHRDT